MARTRWQTSGEDASRWEESERDARRRLKLDACVTACHRRVITRQDPGNSTKCLSPIESVRDPETPSAGERERERERHNGHSGISDALIIG